MARGFVVRWRQVAAAMLIMACAGQIASTYGVVAVPLAQEFHPSRMVMMLAVTIMTLGSGIAAPFLGDLMDKRSLRLLIGIGIACEVGGYLALSMVTAFYQVFIVFAVLMAGANILAGPIAWTVLLTRWFDKYRGRAMGIAISGIAGGTIIFPPLIQFLIDHFGWREGYRVLALILLLLTAPALALVVNRPSERGLYADGADGPPAGATVAEQGPALSMREIVADPSFWLVGTVVTTVMAGMFGMVTNVVPMARDLGIGAKEAALIVSVYAVTGWCAKLGFAALGDRFNPRHMMFLVLALLAAGMACLSRASAGYTVIMIGSGLIGIGGMMLPLQSFVIPRIFGPAVVGRAAGLLSLVTLAGMLAMPPVFGLIYDRTGSYAAIFLTFAGIAAAAMLAVPKIRLHPRAAAVPEPSAKPVGELA